MRGNAGSRSQRALKFVFWAGLLAVSVTWAAIGGGGTAAEAVSAVKTGRSECWGRWLVLYTIVSMRTSLLEITLRGPPP
jgi:hypothetical protein